MNAQFRILFNRAARSTPLIQIIGITLKKRLCDLYLIIIELHVQCGMFSFFSPFPGFATGYILK